MTPHNRTPLFELPERLTGGANAPRKESTTVPKTQEELLADANRDLLGQVKSLHRMSAGTKEPTAPEVKAPLKEADAEWTNIPYSEAEADLVGYSNVIEGPMLLACYKIPEDVEGLNKFLRKAGTIAKPFAYFKRHGPPTTIVTPTGAVVSIWYSEYLYPRKCKTTHDKTS